MPKSYLSASDKQLGFSLIEVLLVVTILAIMCALAIPSVGQYLINRALKTAAEDITGDFFALKHLAVAEGRKYRMKFNSDLNNYEIWRCSNYGPSCGGYTDKVATKSPAAFRNDILIRDVAFGGEGSTVTFQTRGTATPGHVILKNGLDSAATIKINITGRTYVDWQLK